MRFVRVQTPRGTVSVALARPRLLVAEDDDAMRALVVRQLRRTGFEVDEARSGDEALDRLADAMMSMPPELYDLLIADVRMPGSGGIDLLATVRELDVKVPVILITAFGSAELHQEALRLGAVAVFDKPFDLDELGTAVLQALPKTIH